LKQDSDLIRLFTKELKMPIELPLSTMSISEKVQLLEQVWDNLCQQSGEVRSPEWHSAILNERQRQIEEGEMSVSPWSEAKERLRKLGQ
jgi:putative addiction module component (TIGR02574 family)